MHSFSLTAIITFAAASLASPLVGVARRDSPNTLQSLFRSSNPPEAAQAQLVSFIHGGTGCPQSVQVNLTSDHGFPAFVASVGKSVSAAESRKNCQVNVEIVTNPNWKFRINGDNEGYLRTRVNLAVGVKATYKDTYYFSGSTDQASVQYDFAGPLSRTKWVADPAEGFTSAWSPCGGGLLNSNRQVRLTATYDLNVTSSIEYFGSDINPILPFDSFEWASCT